jgi:subtilisin family serine protease
MRRALAVLATAAIGISACTDTPLPSAPDTAPTTPSLAVTTAQQVEPFVAGRVLARFRPGAPAAQIAAAQGAAIDREVTLGILMLSVPAGRELPVAEALSRNPNVEFAELDYLRTFGQPALMPVNDPFIGYKWDLDNDGSIYNSTGSVLATTGKADADMDWKEAYSHLGGSVPGSAVVGVIDTGIRQDHEELAGRIKAQHDFYAGDGDATDDNGHGTHTAGIAAAAAHNGKGVAGVSFANTQLVIAKVCGRSNPGPFGYGCPLSAIAQGVTWAVDNGAHVLNISLGGSSGSSSEQSALQYARSKNVLPFCAAGNDSGAVSYPARYPECVAVSATDWGDNLASYSNFGPEVELSAPGGDDEDPNGYSYILSSYHQSPTSYAFMAGTSMASPQAAGLAALLHALGVTDDDDKLARLKSSADDLGPSGRDNSFGYGRINAYNAVTATGGGGTPTNDPPLAAFTHSCTDLACSFDASGSSDGDGTIASYAWSFGDGASATGVTTSHTYAAGGTYLVTLTVTDDDDATAVASQNVTVSSPPTGGFTLAATGYKVKGVQHADLSWSGATSATVDVRRSGSVIATTANDGAYTDAIGGRGGGSYTYQVCEAGTTTCSNQVTVTF